MAANATSRTKSARTRSTRSAASTRAKSTRTRSTRSAASTRSARNNRNPKTRTLKPKATTPEQRSDAAQIREGVTKARNGAVSYARQAAERVVDVPVGAVLEVRDRVNDAVEPWTRTDKREKELKDLRTQAYRELNKYERRGGQARRKASQRVRSTRNRFEREVKQRRREFERTVKQNRTKVENVVKERVPALS